MPSLKGLLSRLVGGAPPPKFHVPPPRPINPIPPDSDDDDLVPSYPPASQGIPAYSHERIVRNRQYKLLLRAIRDAVANKEDFNTYYWPVITNLLNYVHLLPASQYHHHANAGGLFTHSMQVGLYALRKSKSHIYSPGDRPNSDPKERKRIEPIFQFATFVAGIAHDAGKAISDVMVTDGNALQWEPFKESIHDWAKRHGIERYHVVYAEHRVNAHKALTTALFNKIVTDPITQYLLGGGSELYQMVIEAACDNARSYADETPIYKIVKEADSDSVSKDLASNATQSKYGSTLYKTQIMTAIVSLISKRESGWIPNEPGSCLWLVGDCALLVWPKAAEGISSFLAATRMEGFARNPASIAALMIESKLAARIEVRGERPQKYFFFRPATLAGRDPPVCLRAICIPDASLLFDGVAPPPVDAEILCDPQRVHPDGTSPYDLSLPDRDGNFGPVTIAPIPSPGPGVARNAPPAARTAPDTHAQGGGSSAKPKPPSTQGAFASDQDKGPSLEHATPEALANSREFLLGYKPHGLALIRLLDELREGVHGRRQNVLIRSQRLILQWPEAVSNPPLSITDSLLLKHLQNSNFIEYDPKTHRRAMRDDQGFTKALVLSGNISEHMINLLPPNVRAILAGAHKEPARLPTAAPAPASPPKVTRPPPAAVMEPPPPDVELPSVHNLDYFGETPTLEEIEEQVRASQAAGPGPLEEAFSGFDREEVEQGEPYLEPPPDDGFFVPNEQTKQASGQKGAPPTKTDPQERTFTDAEIGKAVHKLVEISSNPAMTLAEPGHILIDYPAVESELQTCMQASKRQLQPLLAAIGQKVDRGGRTYLRIPEAGLR